MIKMFKKDILRKQNLGKLISILRKAHMAPPRHPTFMIDSGYNLLIWIIDDWV